MNTIQTIIRGVWADTQFSHGPQKQHIGKVTFGKKHSDASIAREVQTIRDRIDRAFGYVPVNFYVYTEDNKTMTVTWV